MDPGVNLLSFTISLLSARRFVWPGIERAQNEMRLQFSIHGGEYQELPGKVKVNTTANYESNCGIAEEI
jgi:hypothetical protein